MTTLERLLAANGLAMTFAAGTSLALDIAPADADVRRYGLYDVLESTPIMLASGVGKLPVTLDVSGVEEPEPLYELGLVTVKDRAIAGRGSCRCPARGRTTLSTLTCATTPIPAARSWQRCTRAG